METLTLYHPWNHEQITVPVITITRTYVTIRWTQSGAYDLNLAQNVLTAHSPAARRRGMCLWKAVDIEKVREGVKIHLDKQDIKSRVREESARHHESMPRYAKKAIPG